VDGRPKPLGRPELRKVREFVLERCPDGFGDLERVAADRGEYRWVCPQHRPLYDKDLPPSTPRDGRRRIYVSEHPLVTARS